MECIIKTETVTKIKVLTKVSVLGYTPVGNACVHRRLIEVTLR